MLADDTRQSGRIFSWWIMPNGGEAAREGLVINGPAGKFIGTSELAEKHALYCWHVAHGMRQGQAAREAGYAHPDVEAVRLNRDPRTAQEILRIRALRLGEREARALDALEQIAEDKGQPAGDRIRAAQAVIDAVRYEREAAERRASGGPISIPDASGRAGKSPEMTRILAFMEKTTLPDAAKQTQTIDMPT